MAETIVLGGLRLEARPLKLGQLRHVLDALEEMAGKSGGGLIEAAARVVAAGLAPTHPELTAEKVLDLEADIEQLNDAVAAVLRTAGLRRPEDGAGAQMMGEAQPVASPGAKPGAGPVSSSPPSTAPSPPAASILIR
ncbi:MAG: hypothetical protein AB7H90_11430 [Alphaproteobacteria bacterium]